MRAFEGVTSRLVRKYLPKVFEALEEMHVSVSAYIVDWIFTLFTRALDKKVLKVAWDLYFVLGEHALPKLCLTIFKILEEYFVKDGVLEGFTLVRQKTNSIKAS